MPLTLMPAGTSFPHGGTPQAIPGIIQAEDFDGGGQDVGYHDTGGGNDGDAYRDTGDDTASAAGVVGNLNYIEVADTTQSAPQDIVFRVIGSP